MPTIHRLEGNAPEMGGILVTWGNNRRLAASWAGVDPSVDTLELAKKATASLLQRLMDEGDQASIAETNWPSLVAGIQKHVADWAGLLRQAIRARMEDPSSRAGGGGGESVL